MTRLVPLVIVTLPSLIPNGISLGSPRGEHVEAHLAIFNRSLLNIIAAYSSIKTNSVHSAELTDYFYCHVRLYINLLLIFAVTYLLNSTILCCRQGDTAICRATATNRNSSVHIGAFPAEGSSGTCGPASVACKL